MTNNLMKTGSFVGVALVLLAGATFATWKPTPAGPGTEFEQGKGFFEDFQDPLAAASLEVSEMNEATAEIHPFKVEVKDGAWTIPSHADYPADGKDRLAKTASGVIDLKKDTVRSISPEDHADLGVIDPLDAKAASPKGRGKRVTLKDKAGNTLSDLIIGKPIKDRAGYRYVRRPGEKATYGVKVDVDLSTNFADWIETNLLKLDASRIRSITFDTTKVDPKGPFILPGESHTLSRKDASSPWTLDGLPDDKEVATDKVQDLTIALGDLKISGVRKKPAGLSRELSVGEKIDVSKRNIAEQLKIDSLVGKGFYPTKEGQLLSTQGDVRITTDEGVVYTLRFGEPTFATGEALSAGSEDEAQKPDESADAETKAEKSDISSRYLMVTVGFDGSVIAQPASLAEPEEASELPRDVFQRTEDEQKAEAAKLDREKADYETRIADGQKKAEELAERFAAWYYLTPDGNFKKIALDRASLERNKGEGPPPGPGGGGANPFGGALPPGFQLPGGHP